MRRGEFSSIRYRDYLLSVESPGGLLMPSLAEEEELPRDHCHLFMVSILSRDKSRNMQYLHQG
jgi:hypothetical protein